MVSAARLFFRSTSSLSEHAILLREGERTFRKEFKGIQVLKMITSQRVKLKSAVLHHKRRRQAPFCSYASKEMK
jgi:hypothetical protein